MPADINNKSQESGKSTDSQSKPLTDKLQEFAAAQKAHPGPAIPKDMPEQEGTKEERQAKAQELNK